MSGPHKRQNDESGDQGYEPGSVIERVSLVKPKVEAVKIIYYWKREKRVVSKAKTPCPLVHEAEPTPNTADYTSTSSRQRGASVEETSSDVCRFEADGTSLLRGLGFLLAILSITPKLLEAVFVISTLQCPLQQNAQKGAMG